jgi:hypothetical protein
VTRTAARQNPPDSAAAPSSPKKPQAKDADKPPKKGLLHRILGVFK